MQESEQVLVDLADISGGGNDGGNAGGYGGGNGGGELEAADMTTTNGTAKQYQQPQRLKSARASVTTLDGDPDQIEVSLEEGAAAPADEVLERAAEFFVEHNDNYVVSWSDASHMISDAAADPSKPPRPGWNAEYLRWRLRRIIESIYFRLATLILILVDIVIVIVDLSLAGSQPGLQVRGSLIQKLDMLVYNFKELFRE